MKIVKKISKYILTLSLTVIIGLGQVSFASELPDYTGQEAIYPMNKGVSLLNDPIVVKKGQTSKEDKIYQLEEAILNNTIRTSAAKFLIDNSPQTIRPIRKSLEKELNTSSKLLKKAEGALGKLKKDDKAIDKNYKKLKDAYISNLVMVESAAMLLNNTPQTIRLVEDKLIGQVNKAEGLLLEAQKIIYEKEKKDFFKLRPLARKTTGLYYQIPSEQSILNYWRNYQTRSVFKRYIDGIYLADPHENLYKVNPDLANNQPGMLKNEVQEDLNHLTNTLRYSAGLYEVGLDEDYSYFAQASSVINSLNGTLTHWPRVPEGFSNDNPLYLDGYTGSENSNIAQNYNILQQIYAYIMDDDEYNWDRVGHRAALLSPTVINMGYGYHDSFSAQLVWGDQYEEEGDEIVVYPANVGLSEFWNEYTPFTATFKDMYDISDVVVTMTDLNTGETLQYKTGYNLFTVNDEEAGNMKSLSWGLGHPGYHGDQYNIKIDGVKKAGKAYPIEYTVNFISLEFGH